MTGDEKGITVEKNGRVTIECQGCGSHMCAGENRANAYDYMTYAGWYFYMGNVCCGLSACKNNILKKITNKGADD